MLKLCSNTLATWCKGRSQRVGHAWATELNWTELRACRVKGWVASGQTEMNDTLEESITKYWGRRTDKWHGRQNGGLIASKENIEKKKKWRRHKRHLVQCKIHQHSHCRGPRRSREREGPEKIFEEIIAGNLQQCRRLKRRGFDPWVRKIPWYSKWYYILVFLPRKFCGQRILVGNSPWVAKSQTGLSTAQQCNTL